jgi:hypothetical protein
MNGKDCEIMLSRYLAEEPDLAQRLLSHPLKEPTTTQQSDETQVDKNRATTPEQKDGTKLASDGLMEELNAIVKGASKNQK